MKRKKSEKCKKQADYEIETSDQDEKIWFIAGYTSSGIAYGTTREEAYADGLVENGG